jgi:hypothetical protein
MKQKITVCKKIFLIYAFSTSINSNAGLTEAYCNSFVPASINLSLSMRQAGAPIGMVDNSINDWDIEDVNMRIFLKHVVVSNVYKAPNNINQDNLIKQCIAYTQGY